MSAPLATVSRLPAGTLVLTPDLAFALEKRAGHLAQFGAYHASQDTRFRDFSTGGSPNTPKPETNYLPRADRARIIARGRVGCRNNPHFASAILAYAQEIGEPTLKSLTSSAEYNDTKERYLEARAAACEAENNLSLEEVVYIILCERIVAGEVFLVFLLDGRVQMIASELCGSPGSSISTRRQLVNIPGARPQTFADGGPIPAGATELDGIVRDAANRIIGYRFGTRDELGAISFAPERSNIVRADYVRHVYDADRTEMGRGVPLDVPALNAFQDVFETAEARAQQVKNASCLSMWITKSIDPTGYAEAMRGALRGESLQNVPALKDIAEKRSGYQEIRRGAVYYGAVGEDLRLIEPKPAAADFHAHYIDLLQVCCACLDGMPVEIAIEGFRNSSYSSARATVNKWKRNVRRRRRRLAADFLDPWQLWQSRRGRIFGELPALPSARPQDSDENVRWGWPPIPDIDGAKTAAQHAIELANGTTTRTAIYADRGEHVDVEDKIYAAEKANLLKQLMEQAINLEFTPEQARAWALAQMPTANAGALAPIIAATLADGAAPAGTPAA